MNEEFQLGKTYKIIMQKVIQEEVSVTFDKLRRDVIDTGAEVKVIVYFQDREPFTGILWNKDTIPSYDGIGKWDDNQANDRILEIFNAQVV